MSAKISVSGLVFWKLLTGKHTDKDARESNSSYQSDSDDDIEGNDKFKERELNKSSPTFPTAMYSVDRPNISPSEIVNVAPGKGQIPVPFHNLTGKYSHFLKTIPHEETTLTRKEKVQ